MSVDMDMGLDQSKPERESHLIKLPVELRLSIYDFALLDSPAVTIGHAEVVGAHYDVVSLPFVPARARQKYEQSGYTS